MTTKIKHEVSAAARLRLNDALQELVQRRDDSADEEPIATLELERSSSPLVSPTKKGGEGKSSARKRRRKESENDMDYSSQRTYITKLFDRTIDLAQFNENSNLYPICRAWLKNDPHTQYSADATRVETKDQNGDPNNVYHLPDPVLAKCPNLLIPLPLFHREDKLDIHADPERAKPPEQLLLDHMARWKLIRSSWLESSRKHEMQYEKSLSLLKSMYQPLKDTP